MTTILRYAGLIALVISVFVPLHSVRADAALYLSPDKGMYALDSLFTVDVLVDTGTNDSMTAAEAEFTFDTRRLAVESISTEGSVLTSWSTTPVYSNESASIRFTGWAGVPFSGSSGRLLRITFRTRASGVGSLQFISGSVLSANGQASNILSVMRSAAYTVSPTHVMAEPAQEATTSSAQVLGTATDFLPPEFTENVGAIRVGETIRVRGTTIPDGKVVFRITNAGGSDEESAVLSNIDGTFSFATNPITEAGVYRVIAHVEKDGAKSDSSERIVITVSEQSSLVAAVGTIARKATPFLALIVFAGLCLGFMLHHNARARREFGSEGH